MASRNASRTDSEAMLVPSGTAGSSARETGAARASSMISGFASSLSAGSALFFFSSGAADLSSTGAAGCASASASSSSPAISAMTVPTATSSLPASTRILVITPSSTASNSIVALSVSISANMSPELTLSPSLTSHLATVPTSMVGDRAGIFSWIAINIAPPARWYRVRTVPVPAIPRQSQPLPAPSCEPSCRAP